MSQLVACPFCNRHVRATERGCPFCAGELPPAPAPVAAVSRTRVSRAALFAASATLIGAAACSSPSTNSPDAASDAGSTGGSGGGGSGGGGGQTDGGGDDRGAVPIYSAVFPPQTTRLALATPDEVPGITLPGVTHPGITLPEGRRR